MFQAKFQDSLTSGLEEVSYDIYVIYRHSVHLDHVTWSSYIQVRSLFPEMLHKMFGFDWSIGFIEDI